jgi:hypothetical protein
LTPHAKRAGSIGGSAREAGVARESNRLNVKAIEATALRA